MKKTTTQSVTIPKDLQPFLIGIWQFREVGQPRRWCATYYYRGLYYDVTGRPTPQEAVDAVGLGVQQLRKRKKPKQ